MAKANLQKTKTPMAELDPAYRATCFEEVAGGYTLEEAVNEAKRCIHCKHQPCVTGCPVGVPIPAFLKELGEGNVAGAYAIVKNANSLPAICGRVCPQETQCEGVCTRGRNGEPVAIGRLERFVADWALGGSAVLPNGGTADAAEPSGTPSARDDEGSRAEHATPSASHASGAPEGSSLASPATGGSIAGDDIADDFDYSGKRVAVVGSGPAGLTCAGELAKHGVQVRVFEALHEVGGVLVYGIPEFRLPKSLVKQEVSAIEQMGVEFETNAVVGKLYDVRELLDDMGYDAVFVGTGAGLPSYLGIEGEALNGVSVANELLTRVNLMKAFKFPEYATPVYAGKKCVVVGGGNVAMDAARTARRLGADVTVVYRRGREEMPARAEEIHHAEEEGIVFQLLTNPVRILGDEQGWVTGVECVRMELGEPDASGRRRPVPVEGSEFTIDVDMLVVAAGSRTNPLIGQTTPGLETTKWNTIVTDEETGATSVPGVFAGGDVSTGAATVILAMGAGKRAAAGILDYLRG